MESLERLLSEHAFFRGMDPPYLELIAGCGSNVRFRADTFIFREGEPADLFYLIRHGKVALEIGGVARGPIVIQTVGPDEVVGWSWLFEPYEWNLDARVVEDVRAISFAADCLRLKCEADTRLGYEMMQRFAQVILQRLDATRYQLLDVYGHAGAR
ncbi:MAG: cyclic nucleotide-binding domain-containing protein [Actinomycetota bacterium]